jgi:hypothetical protein
MRREAVLQNLVQSSSRPPSVLRHFQLHRLALCGLAIVIIVFFAQHCKSAASSAASSPPPASFFPCPCHRNLTSRTVGRTVADCLQCTMADHLSSWQSPVFKRLVNVRQPESSRARQPRAAPLPQPTSLRHPFGSSQTATQLNQHASLLPAAANQGRLALHGDCRRRDPITERLHQVRLSGQKLHFRGIRILSQLALDILSKPIVRVLCDTNVPAWPVKAHVQRLEFTKTVRRNKHNKQLWMLRHQSSEESCITMRSVHIPEE